MTMAPLIVNGKVMVGVSAASSACAASLRPTSRERPAGLEDLHHPGPGEPGHETWKATPGSAAAPRFG